MNSYLENSEVELLLQKPNQLALETADALGTARSAVIAVIYGKLEGLAAQGGD